MLPRRLLPQLPGPQPAECDSHVSNRLPGGIDTAGIVQQQASQHAAKRQVAPHRGCDAEPNNISRNGFQDLQMGVLRLCSLQGQGGVAWPALASS